jgi:RNA polymerase sigma factor (sigma-70 family)
LLRQALGELDEKEERVLRLRFGLDGADPKTLKEIGEMLSLSRERIRQIESQALDKLNRSQKCQRLRGYLN